MTRAGQRVFLHIGGMKTGTSFVQHVLRDNTDALADDGAVFAGRRGWRDQVHGVRDVLQMKGPRAPARDLSGAWERLLKGMTRSPADQIVSMEFLSFTGVERAAHIVASLGPAQVHVVLSVRDAGRVIPAQWQEHTQNRGELSWQQWCHGVTDSGTPPHPARRVALQALRIPHMVRSWAPTVPAGRFHVVTVPPSGSPPGELWNRFARALSLRAEHYRLPAQAANESLGHVSAELMRRLNERLGDLSVRDYSRVVKKTLGKQVLAARVGEPKVVLPETLTDFAADWDRRSVQAIRESSAQVIGDLGDLELRTPTDASVVQVSEAALLEVAREAVEQLASGPAVSRAGGVAEGHASRGGTGQLVRALDDLERAVRARIASGR